MNFEPVARISKAPQVPSLLMRGVLQRKCACGQHTQSGGECSECKTGLLPSAFLQRKSADVQDQTAYTRHFSPLNVTRNQSRDSTNVAEHRKIQTVAQETPDVLEEPLGFPSHGLIYPKFNHNFCTVPLRTNSQVEAFSAIATTQWDHRNAVLEDDFIHGPLIEEFRRREAELGNPAAHELSDGEIKHRGLFLPCPRRTEVDRVVDMTPAGLRDGFRTAYGAMAVMRVFPRERTWDGTQISESLTEQSNTCPATLSREPLCSGDSVFTVGASGRSSRLGNQPGLVNRFYDFHTSRSRNVSFLHDSTRNPNGLNSCAATCEQTYTCQNTVLGRHVVTRNFKKGVHAGHDVTIVDVTKT